MEFEAVNRVSSVVEFVFANELNIFEKRAILLDRGRRKIVDEDEGVFAFEVANLALHEGLFTGPEEIDT